ncbi:MAG: SDR family oxidoreductase [Planctomycetota bacterium]
MTAPARRYVVVTGSSGGIGSAICSVFHDAGWFVFGVDRSSTASDAVHEFIQADISDPAAPAEIFDRVRERTDGLAALVNNAAVQICKPIIETTPEEWDAVMASNLRSVFLSVRESFSLLKHAAGSVINISSVHAMATSRNIGAYAASKGALLALTRSLALEFGEYGIRVNAVLPGAVDTPMLHAGLSRGHVQASSLDGLVRGLGKKHVLGRVGTPEEIGRAVLFLADPAHSSFMTGQSLVVDGGALARLSTE